ncbi:MCP four helix bundle domain-containing protein [Roseateles violae]|uniref:MCP four helix bundle domain-containing protein n=1 Tax=Roseateles violae TaxID=3058042 RepID=A0ABT8DLN8_9BURK|nr:GAF domain-containing protein [Pelomonas sp. PFR6]MDN3919329.1 MCP four helix bundle domain-containing protein [Pelomonas sp. PFR6]
MDLPKSFTLKTRLALLVGLVLLLMAATGLLTLLQLHGLSRSVDSLYQDRLRPMQQLRLVSKSFSVDLQSSAQRLADGRLSAVPARSELDAIERQVRAQWAAYKATFLVEAEQRLIARAEPLLATGLQRLAQLRELSERGDTEALRRFPALQLQPAAEAIANVIGELIEVQLDVGRREASAAREAFELALWLVLGLLLATLALALGLAASVAMLHRREQGSAEAARARLQRFYVALSQTSQLMVRAPASAQLLYEGLCRICVDSGGALLAAVVQSDGEQFERVAVHGPVERLMPGVPTRWQLDSAFAQASLSTEAVRSGRHALSNRVMDDAKLSQWRAGVIPPGVEAMAAFPLRRGGRVMGALTLLAGERDFFDAEMTALLDEMVDDVSFALDNLDREQARRQALREAEDGRALFQLLFNAAAVSCALTTLAEGRVVEVNETLCQRYGYSREELLGRRFGELRVGLGKLARERFYQLLQTEGRVRNFETEIRNRAGEPLRSLVNADVIDYRGEVCVLSSSIDISSMPRA